MRNPQFCLFGKMPIQRPWFLHMRRHELLWWKTDPQNYAHDPCTFIILTSHNRFKSTTTPFFFNHLFSHTIKKSSRVSVTVPLWGESSGYRWPHSQGANNVDMFLCHVLGFGTKRSYPYHSAVGCGCQPKANLRFLKSRLALRRI